MNNQEVRPEIVNVNSKDPVVFPFSIKTSKGSGTCNIPNVVTDINVKVLNLISRTYDLRHIKWHETCKCKCRLDASACNNKQRWNKDKCRYECKELIEKGVCNKGFVWDPSNCECECDKSCHVGEYLDYKNC